MSNSWETMKSTLAKIFKDCFTEKNGDYDPIRILGIIDFLVYNSVTVIHALNSHHPFDPIAYSTGMSILLGVISAGITFKYRHE